MAIFPFIFQFIHNFLFTLCKCNIQETETTNKMVLYCFCSFKHRCRMSGVIYSMQTKAFEREIIKKFAVIVSLLKRDFFLQTLGILTKMSEDYFLKLKRLLSEYQLF